MTRFIDQNSQGAVAWVPPTDGPLNRPVVYISGPMTGLPDANYPAFHAAERLLVGLGCVVLNPARNFNGEHGHPRSDYMRLDIDNLLQAGAIYMLHGWERSHGALLEHLIAQELNLLIIYQDNHIIETPWMPTDFPRAEVQQAFDDCWDEWADDTDVYWHSELDSQYQQRITPPPQLAPSVLQEAQGLIHGDRNESYGHPLDDFTRTGRIWGAILGIPDVSAEHVGLCMDAVKTSRACNDLDLQRPIKRDNLVDKAGYTGTVEMCQDERLYRQTRVGARDR